MTFDICYLRNRLSLLLFIHKLCRTIFFFFHYNSLLLPLCLCHTNFFFTFAFSHDSISITIWMEFVDAVVVPLFLLLLLLSFTVVFIVVTLRRERVSSSCTDVRFEGGVRFMCKCRSKRSSGEGMVGGREGWIVELYRGVCNEHSLEEEQRGIRIPGWNRLNPPLLIPPPLPFFCVFRSVLFVFFNHFSFSPNLNFGQKTKMVGWLAGWQLELQLRQITNYSINVCPSLNTQHNWKNFNFVTLNWLIDLTVLLISLFLPDLFTIICDANYFNSNLFYLQHFIFPIIVITFNY